MKNKFVLFFVCVMMLFSSITTLTDANSMITSNYNSPPNPPVIDGPLSGKIKETYTYTVTVLDPDEDDLLIRIEINFGDATTACGGCDGRGPWNSGESVLFDHSWNRIGTFEITGRVQDEHGVWSDWSKSLTITMPKVEINFYSIFRSIHGLFPNLYNTN